MNLEKIKSLETTSLNVNIWKNEKAKTKEEKKWKGNDNPKNGFSTLAEPGSLKVNHPDARSLTDETSLELGPWGAWLIFRAGALIVLRMTRQEVQFRVRN